MTLTALTLATLKLTAMILTALTLTTVMLPLYHNKECLFSREKEVSDDNTGFSSDGKRERVLRD